MPCRILSLQSHVVFGHVGNSAAVFPLQRLGCEMLPIDTVQFSSHAGYPGWRGRAFEAALIDELLEGLKAVGALERCDAVLTGYLGKPELGEAALRALDAVRAANPDAVYACDPVIGDVGRGVYVRRWRARILPRARPASRRHSHPERIRARLSRRPRDPRHRGRPRGLGAIARAGTQGDPRHFG